MSDGVVQTFLFRAPYHLEPHGSEENGLNWKDGFIPYDQVFTVLNEAVAIYDHLYASDKCHLLNGILGRPIHNFETLQVPRSPGTEVRGPLLLDLSFLTGVSAVPRETPGPSTVG